MWSALGFYEHIWNPKWRTSWFGGYVNVDYNGAATNSILRAHQVRWRPAASDAVAPTTHAVTLVQGNSCSPDYSFWEAGTRTQWNPVPQLDVGLEVLYSSAIPPSKAPPSCPPTSRVPSGLRVIDDQSVWSAMFRWQRNFYP